MLVLDFLFDEKADIPKKSRTPLINNKNTTSIGYCRI